jgi:hypothetical protein
MTALRKTDRVAQLLRNAIRIATPFYFMTYEDITTALRNCAEVNPPATQLRNADPFAQLLRKWVSNARSCQFVFMNWY